MPDQTGVHPTCAMGSASMVAAPAVRKGGGRDIL